MFGADQDTVALQWKEPHLGGPSGQSSCPENGKLPGALPGMHAVRCCSLAVELNGACVSYFHLGRAGAMCLLCKAGRGSHKRGQKCPAEMAFLFVFETGSHCALQAGPELTM